MDRTAGADEIVLSGFLSKQRKKSFVKSGWKRRWFELKGVRPGTSGVGCFWLIVVRRVSHVRLSWDRVWRSRQFALTLFLRPFASASARRLNQNDVLFYWKTRNSDVEGALGYIDMCNALSVFMENKDDSNRSCFTVVTAGPLLSAQLRFFFFFLCVCVCVCVCGWVCGCHC